MGRGKYVSHIHNCKYTRDKYVSAKLVREMNREICFMGFPLPLENSIDIFILSIFYIFYIFYIAISFHRESSKYKWISYSPTFPETYTIIHYYTIHYRLYTIHTLYTIIIPPPFNWPARLFRAAGEQ